MKMMKTRHERPATSPEYRKQRTKKIAWGVGAVALVACCTGVAIENKWHKTDRWNQDWPAAIEPQPIGPCYPERQAGNRKDGPPGDTPTTDPRQNGALPPQPDTQPKRVRDRIAAATVKIHDNSGMATGFFVINDRGERVVVTAGHAIKGHDLQMLAVRDYKGNTSTVSGACYMYNESASGARSATDVAVLRLEDSQALGDGKSALKIPENHTDPERGQSAWVYSLQKNLPHQDAAVFSVQTIAPMTFLSGINNNRSCEPSIDGISTCAFQEGGSGSPITDKQGNLLGVATTGNTDGEPYMPTHTLRDDYNVALDIPTGEGTGNWPVVIGATSVASVLEALESNAY